MNIHIKVVPRSKMRKIVSGADWFWDKRGNLQVRIEPMSDWRYEVLLCLHEAIEAVLCKHNGVSQTSVDEFDVEYDKHHATDCNAGDDPKAPYRREHCLATACERVIAAELDVCWETYDKELATSYPGPSKR